MVDGEKFHPSNKTTGCKLEMDMNIYKEQDADNKDEEEITMFMSLDLKAITIFRTKAGQRHKEQM